VVICGRLFLEQAGVEGIFLQQRSQLIRVRIALQICNVTPGEKHLFA
jgi:hypothetical protein